MEGSYSFGAWVHQRRKVLRLTQREVASLVACSLVLIQKIESDGRRPSAHVAARLAHALQIPHHQIATFVRVARAELATDRLAILDHGPAHDRALTIHVANQVVQPHHPPGNLPSSVSSFHGRKREISDILALLQQPYTRLITLAGPGGIGKTRLALHVAEEVTRNYPHGIWFIDLAPISETQQIAATLAQTLAIAESPTRSIHESLLHWLRERHVLLIIDNCEHVRTDAADLIATLLRNTSKLSILATSRIPLRLTAEQEYQVTPLGLPRQSLSQTVIPLPTQHQIGGADLSSSDAETLFVTRARAVRADFALTQSNAATIAAICIQLDGLPLAIELAAARIRFFPPEEVLRRLIASGVQTLTGGARDLPARQQTIRATIDWSYRLLEPSQQKLLARLSVFVGSWTRAAALVICSDHMPGEQEDPLIALDDLIEHSLVRMHDEFAEPRYTMLDTIRAYALERLRERGEEELLRHRHAAGFAELLERREQAQALDFVEWLHQNKRDLPNIVSALEWCEDNEDTVAYGLRILGTLNNFWELGAGLNRGIIWQRRFVARMTPEMDAGIRARLLLALLRLETLNRSDSIYFRELLTQLLPLVDSANHPSLTAMTLMIQGDVFAYSDGALEQSLFYYEAATEQFRRLNDSVYLCEALLLLGFACHGLQGHIETGYRYFDEARTIAQQCRRVDIFCRANNTLAWPELNEGRLAAANSCLQESLVAARFLDDRWMIPVTLRDLSHIALYSGDLHTARTRLNQAMEIHHEQGFTSRVNMAALVLAEIDIHMGNFRAAIQLLEGLDSVNVEPAYAVTDTLVPKAMVMIAQGQLELAKQHVTTGILATHGTSNQHRDTVGRLHTLASTIYYYQGELSMAYEELIQSTVVRQGALTQLWCLEYYVDYARIALAMQQSEVARLYLRLRLAPQWRSFLLPKGSNALELSAALLSAHGHASAAARLLGAAEALREQIGTPIWPIDRPEYERWVAHTMLPLASQEWEAAWAAGRRLSWEQAADQALVELDLIGHAASIPPS